MSGPGEEAVITAGPSVAANRLMERLRPGYFALAIFGALAVITAIYLFSTINTHGAEVLAQWQSRWPLLLACLGLNGIGLLLEFIGWRWMYLRCGIRLRGFNTIILFFSLYAAFILPAQLARLVRPGSTKRLGFGSSRDALEAEAVLFFLHMAGTATLIAALAVGLAHPWLAPVAGVTTLALSLAAGDLACRLSRRYFVHIRPGLIWSVQGAIIALFRTCDRALLGLILLLLVAPLAPNMTYATAALYSLTADLAGAASGLPGGAIVVEGVLASLLRWSELPHEHIGIAVTVFRLIYFWSILPVGWLALLATYGIQRRRLEQQGMTLQ